jgi:hypothetical protein
VVAVLSAVLEHNKHKHTTHHSLYTKVPAIDIAFDKRTDDKFYAILNKMRVNFSSATTEIYVTMQV